MPRVVVPKIIHATRCIDYILATSYPNWLFKTSADVLCQLYRGCIGQGTKIEAGTADNIVGSGDWLILRDDGLPQ